MKNILLVVLAFTFLVSHAQIRVDLSGVKQNGAVVKAHDHKITIDWPAGTSALGRMVLNLDSSLPLFHSIQLGQTTALKEIAQALDPVFILRTGKRKLDPASGGWDIFFDNVYKLPYTTELVAFSKRTARVFTNGSKTVIKIGTLHAALFTGELEITIYNGSPLFNVAAVISTQRDSTAILYDAGLINKKEIWKQVAWSDVKGVMQYATPATNAQSNNLEVKYRTVIGENETGSLAVFPAPHQYFYPLDEAFNLKFTWYGNHYLGLVPGFGLGIRQLPEGDRRYVPWFNAPPNTRQRLNFFCLVSNQKAGGVLEDVKKFTHNDSFAPLEGYKTMASHFHNEFISDVVLKNKAIPENPEFVQVLKKAGLDIVKLAEFHGPGHPKGPDSLRLRELNALFEQTKRLSDSSFLLLPGEEANNFYGGHWLAFFPKPVYWAMSRPEGTPFMAQHPQYGKVYHVGDKHDMLKLLETEKGLAWVAHARTKASTGYPDKYREEDFFKSDTYFGAAWKAIPADLSWFTLSKRVLNLMDDMANWGLKKYAIAESDIFTITEQNEMYAHLNVNYLRLKELPDYNNGWQPVLDAMRNGAFFVSTGEVLIPHYSIKGKQSGETVKGVLAKTKIDVELEWTFPLNFAEIVSGDGKKVYRERIDLNNTRAFGKQKFQWTANLNGRKWVRVEAWDIAANGAFTQMIWLE